MRLRLPLAGKALSWRFTALEQLESWLGQQPWLGRGGALALRVSGPRQAQWLLGPIDAAIRAADAGASNVIVRVASPAPSFDLGDVLRDALELDVDPGSRPSLERLARLAQAQPFVVLVDATASDAAAARRLSDGLQQVMDAAAKLTPGAALTALVMHHGPLWAGGAELPLDGGEPCEALLDTVFERDIDLWRAYIHFRLAWEAAGSTDLALLWGEALEASSLGFGDDDHLEKLLSELALRAYRDISEEQRELADVCMVTPSEAVSSKELSRQALERRCLWTRCGVTRVVPWLARVGLMGSPTPALRAQLRWCLVCAPIRQELLSGCLDIESAARASHWREHGDPPAEARGDWEAFKLGDPSKGAQFYPPSSPARPDGPFAFVDLGAFLAGARLGAVSSALHRLRVLRNHLAHGHQASWACVREFAGLRMSLAP